MASLCLFHANALFRVVSSQQKNRSGFHEIATKPLADCEVPTCVSRLGLFHYRSIEEFYDMINVCFNVGDCFNVDENADRLLIEKYWVELFTDAKIFKKCSIDPVSTILSPRFVFFVSSTDESKRGCGVSFQRIKSNFCDCSEDGAWLISAGELAELPLIRVGSLIKELDAVQVLNIPFDTYLILMT